MKYIMAILTAVVKRGEKQFVALCPELDVASQGKTIEKALDNLKEAVELHIEVMGLPEEISNEETLVTTIKVSGSGKTSKAFG